MGGKVGEIIYPSLHCHHQNDSCIKVGNDKSHFNVSLIVKTKTQDSVHRPQLLKRKESRSGFEPKSFCLPALRLAARPDWLTQPAGWLVECCFTSTETVALLGTGAQDGHLDFHTAPELCLTVADDVELHVLGCRLTY